MHGSVSPGQISTTPGPVTVMDRLNELERDVRELEKAAKYYGDCLSVIFNTLGIPQPPLPDF